jgi:hypothetical protein
LFRRYFFVLILLGQCQRVAAQSFWVGSQNDQLLRIISLQDSALNHSQMIRPIRPDSLRSRNPLLAGWLQKNTTLLKRKAFVVNALPLDWVNQFNTHHPYGWNDGPMIGAKGYQTLLRTGIQFKSKYVDVQLAPELVYATNAPYATNANYGPSSFSAFNKAYIGQSHVKLKLGKIGLGISTENLWWGTGFRSSLLMSNNAPGFPHWTFHTNRPIKSPIGFFEFQLVGGLLSSIQKGIPYEHFSNRSLLSNSRDRYFSGYSIVYTPNWFRNFSIGFSRAINHYYAELKGQSSLLRRGIPILFQPVDKRNLIAVDTVGNDQVASFFFKYKLVDHQFEFYGEYGYNDYKLNARDYVMGTTHSAAYLIGFKKTWNSGNEVLYDLTTEITKTTQSPDRLVREAGDWYTHSYIAEGYTNQNQIMGVGAGLGTNLQTVQINRFQKKHVWGASFEHIERKPHLMTNTWNDWVIGIQHKRRYEKLFVDAQLQFVNSNNYAWDKGKNTFNLFARLGLTYTW